MTPMEKNIHVVDEQGNILGQAKANALRDMIQGRETTNQRLLRLYERMYDDLFSRPRSTVLLPNSTDEA